MSAGLDRYDDLLQGRSRREPMRFLAALSAPVDIAARLGQSGRGFREDGDRLVVAGDDLPSGQCEVSSDSRDEGFRHVVGRDLSLSDRIALTEARHAVAFEAVCGRDRQHDVAAVMRLLGAVCPEAVGIYDANAFR